MENSSPSEASNIILTENNNSTENLNEEQNDLELKEKNNELNDQEEFEKIEREILQTKIENCKTTQNKINKKESSVLIPLKVAPYKNFEVRLSFSLKTKNRRFRFGKPKNFSN